MGQREPWRAQLATWSMVVLGGEWGVSGWMEDMGVDDRVGLDNEGEGDSQCVLEDSFFAFLAGEGDLSSLLLDHSHWWWWGRVAGDIAGLLDGCCRF
jgi:hypothetical protein